MDDSRPDAGRGIIGSSMLREAICLPWNHLLPARKAARVARAAVTRSTARCMQSLSTAGAAKCPHCRATGWTRPAVAFARNVS